MGLAAREIEAAGFATLVLSVMPDVTASVGAPRVVGISQSPGSPFGAPGDADTQRDILRAALDAFEQIESPGGRIDLDFVGPPRRQRLEPEEPSPIVRLLRRQPWLVKRMISGDIPAPP